MIKQRADGVMLRANSFTPRATRPGQGGAHPATEDSRSRLTRDVPFPLNLKSALLSLCKASVALNQLQDDGVTPSGLLTLLKSRLARTVKAATSTILR